MDLGMEMRRLDASDNDKSIVSSVLGSLALGHLLTCPISSQCSLISASNDKILRGKLSNLVDYPKSDKFSWNYAIFWHLSRAHSGDFVLGWGDGSCRELKQEEINGYIPVSACLVDYNTQQYMRKKVLETLTTLFGRSDEDKYVHKLSQVTDMELFFLASMYFTFPVGGGGPGRCYQSRKHEWHDVGSQNTSEYCVRSHIANSAGIKTVVLIPIGVGVLELGSVRPLPESLNFVQYIRSTFSLRATQVPNHARSGLGINLTGPGSSRPLVFSSPEAKSTAIHAPKPCQKGKKPINGREEELNHIEAERLGQENLDQQLCALKAIIPNASKLDEVSLLDGAIRYIKGLQQKVTEIETMGSGSRVCNTEIDIQPVGNKLVAVNLQCPMNNHPLAEITRAFVEAKVTVIDSKISAESDRVSHTFIIKHCGSEQILRNKLAAILLSQP